MPDYSITAEPLIERADIGEIALKLGGDRLWSIHHLRDSRIELALHILL
jgi:hypothetical protein